MQDGTVTEDLPTIGSANFAKFITEQIMSLNDYSVSAAALDPYLAELARDPEGVSEFCDLVSHMSVNIDSRYFHMIALYFAYNRYASDEEKADARHYQSGLAALKLLKAEVAALKKPTWAVVQASPTFIPTSSSQVFM